MIDKAQDKIDRTTRALFNAGKLLKPLLTILKKTIYV